MPRFDNYDDFIAYYAEMAGTADTDLSTCVITSQEFNEAEFLANVQQALNNNTRTIPEPSADPAQSITRITVDMGAYVPFDSAVHFTPEEIIAMKTRGIQVQIPQPATDVQDDTKWAKNSAHTNFDMGMWLNRRLESSLFFNVFPPTLTDYKFPFQIYWDFFTPNVSNALTCTAYDYDTEEVIAEFTAPDPLELGVGEYDLQFYYNGVSIDSKYKRVKTGTEIVNYSYDMTSNGTTFTIETVDPGTGWPEVDLSTPNLGDTYLCQDCNIKIDGQVIFTIKDLFRYTNQSNIPIYGEFYDAIGGDPLMCVLEIGLPLDYGEGEETRTYELLEVITTPNPLYIALDGVYRARFYKQGADITNTSNILHESKFNYYNKIGSLYLSDPIESDYNGHYILPDAKHAGGGLQTIWATAGFQQGVPTVMPNADIQAINTLPGTPDIYGNTQIQTNDPSVTVDFTYNASICMMNRMIPLSTLTETITEVNYPTPAWYLIPPANYSITNNTFGNSSASLFTSPNLGISGIVCVEIVFSGQEATRIQSTYMEDVDTGIHSGKKYVMLGMYSVGDAGGRYFYKSGLVNNIMTGVDYIITAVLIYS